MFRAVPCSSSGGQIVLLQPLVSSLSVNNRTVRRYTVRLFTEGDNTRGCNNTNCPPEDEQGTARNNVEDYSSSFSTGILYGRLQTVTIPEAVILQFVLLKMSRVLLETC